MKIVSVILLIVIILSVLAVGAFICNKVFLEKEPAYIGTVMGAFMGAFFAFVFVRIGSFFAGLYARQVKHYNALISLEHIYNDYFNLISDNISTIDGFSKITANSSQDKPPVISADRLDSFIIDKEIPLRLGNVDLINDVFSLNVGLSKMNSSIETVNRFYEQLRDSFIQQKTNRQTYETNVKVYIEKLIVIRKFLIDLEKEIKGITATARLLARDKPLTNCFHSFVLKTHYTKKLKSEIPKEIEKLEDEMAGVKAKSRKKIEEISKNKS